MGTSATCAEVNGKCGFLRSISGSESRWKPVAMTVIFTRSFILSSSTTPKLICTSLFSVAVRIRLLGLIHIVNAQLTEAVMLINTPRAPSTPPSSISGLLIACRAASTGALSPERDGGSHHRVTHPGMIVRISEKSRLLSPCIRMISAIPRANRNRVPEDVSASRLRRTVVRSHDHFGALIFGSKAGVLVDKTLKRWQLFRIVITSMARKRVAAKSLP